MAPERRENDTVAVPKSAITFAAGVVTLLLGGFGHLLWVVTSASISLDQRVGHLEDFQQIGERFTKQDGDRVEDRVTELERWRQAHTEFGYEIVGRWNTLHSEHQRRLRELERENESNGLWNDD